MTKDAQFLLVAAPRHSKKTFRLASSHIAAPVQKRARHRSEYETEARRLATGMGQSRGACVTAARNAAEIVDSGSEVCSL